MLEVQKYLQAGKTLDDLSVELGIKANRHHTLPLVILNYDQLESPKTHPVVRECRGLVLNTDDWSLAARGFSRFFNWGELADEMKLFDFDHCSTTTKEDGSFVLVYNFCNQWRINTRNSYAEFKMDFQPFTWTEAIIRTMGFSQLSDLDHVLDKSLSYVFEFCSPWNKVVRRYPTPQMFLLTAFCGEQELHIGECDVRIPALFKRPERFDFHNIEEVQEYLAQQAETDPTYEGVVLRDQYNHRWKVKSATYLGLHRLGSDKACLFAPKNLLPFILTGETDELLCYYEEVRPALESYQQQFEDMVDGMMPLWEDWKDEPDQKMFAYAVEDHPLKCILFEARRDKSDPEKVLRKNPNVILDRLKTYSLGEDNVPIGEAV